MSAFANLRYAIEKVRIEPAHEFLSAAHQSLAKAIQSGKIDISALKGLSAAIHGASCNQDDLGELNFRLSRFTTSLTEYLNSVVCQSGSSPLNVDGQVDARRTLAKQLSLSALAVEIYGKIHHGSQLVVMEEPLADTAEPSSEEEEIRFSFQGHKYRFKIRHDWGKDAGSDENLTATPAILVFCSEEGAPLFSTDVILQSSSQSSWYAVPEDETFVHGFVPGEWLTDFLALYAQVAIENKKSHFFADALREEQQKQNFGL